jgi:REP element-mobilizing transposase RayT
MGMSRPHRDDSPDAVFHVTARVNWRVFHLEPDHCTDIFYGLLAGCLERFDVDLLSDVLMSNHFHLVVRSPAERRYRELTTRRTRCRHRVPWPKGHEKRSVLSQFMKRLMYCSSMLIQDKLGLTGRFWEEPYHARRVLDDTDLIATIAYDHRNPVEAGMVTAPTAYARSSAGWWSGVSESPVPLMRRPPPFGLDLESLRQEIIRYQESRAFADAMAEYAASGGMLGSAEALTQLKEVLRNRGLMPGRGVEIRTRQA